MAKRRRGSRTARPAPADTARSRSWSTAPSTPSRCRSPSALDEVAIVIADEPSADQRRENELEPGRDALRPVRGRAADRMGRRLGADPEPDHALPAAARGGLRRPGRPRRRGLDHGHPRARPPPRHRRRPARTSSASTDRQPAQHQPRRCTARPSSAAAEPEQHRPVSQRNRVVPGRRHGRIAIAAGPDVIEADRRVGQPDEHHDLRRDRERETVKRSVPKAKTPAMIPIVIEGQAGRPGVDASPRASNRRRAMSSPATSPRRMSRSRCLEDRDEGGRDLPRPEDPERAARRLDGSTSPRTTPAQHVGERRADQRRDERRRRRPRRRSAGRQRQEDGAQDDLSDSDRDARR